MNIFKGQNQRICLLGLMILIANFLWGAYIINNPIRVTQPNGSELDCFASGDEFHNWLHDTNNYTIIQSPTTGYYVYAEKNGDEVIAGNIIAGRGNPQSKGLVPGINISEKDYKLKRTQRNIKSGSKNAPTSGIVYNLVVFVRFSDDDEFEDNIDTYDNLCNNSTSGYNSMTNYFSEVSYGTLTVQSPFYPEPSAGIVVSYQDSHPRDYFRPFNEVTNTIGYDGDTESRLREHALLRDASNYIALMVPADLNIDADNNGKVDNVTYIIKGNTDGWSDLLWPHRWTLSSYIANIRGKRVYDYNFQLQEHLVSSGNGVMCHEFFHTLGAPDLYHYNSNGINPAGKWDIMDSNQNPPQHMNSYMKWKYGGWITSIPTITADQLYTLNPSTFTNDQVYRIDSPNSASEYYIVEYRKKTGTFESSLPGSGLIVWRVNTLAGNGNAVGPPDELYVYRPGGTNSINGTTDNAYFSLDSSRTKINDMTSPSPFLQDGSAGGLSLYHIGSAGETINFYKGPEPEGIIDFTINPVIEDLEGVYYPSDGWSTAILTGNYGFDRVTTGVYSPHSNSQMLKYDSFNAASGSSAIIATPKINISSTTLYTYSLSFWMFRFSTNPTIPDRILVYTNTSNDLTGTPVLLGTINRSSNLSPTVGANGWYQYSYDLNFETTGYKYVIFQAISGNGSSMILDDISITRTSLGTTPNCAINPAPANSTTDISRTASLNWENGGADPTGYRLYLGTNNPPNNLLNGIDVENVTTYSPELSFNTAYFWKVVPYNGYGEAIDCPIWTFSTVQDETLPIELSSFTAIPTANQYVRINWITQSETSLIGFSIYRNSVNQVNSAIAVSPLIAGTNTSNEKNYSYADTLESSGTYYYWLQSKNMNGGVNNYGPIMTIFSKDDNSIVPGIPVITALESIYPNPFNPSTIISYSLLNNEKIQISVYDIKGRKVRNLISENKPAGIYHLLWNGNNDTGNRVASGIYFVRMIAGKYATTKKIMLLK